jgi:acetyltransferase-like isoleucine patch superfamily enzyme
MERAVGACRLSGSSAYARVREEVEADLMGKADRLVNFALRAPSSLGSRLRIALMRLAGARIGPNCRLEKVQWPRNPWDISLGEGVALDRDVVLVTTGERTTAPRIIIGPRTYINRWTMIDASFSVVIGADVMVGPGCYITDHDHGTRPGVPVSQMHLREAATSIGDNVWIGANATILKGVQIGRDAVVGAGSVVTRDVGPGERVAGVPAVVMRRDIAS